MTSVPKIIYMGTPAFAVPSLYRIHQSVAPVQLVVTQPDRPTGRGRKIFCPPVKEAALHLGCNVLQPTSVRTPEFADTIRKIEPDIIVVVAYGHILTKELLEIPKLGALNIHASLLPKYRGPAPIQWAIINREPVTGVTIMAMDTGLDTGDVLAVRQHAIRPDDTSQSLHDRLAEIGADLLVETLEAIRTGAVIPVPQKHDEATYAPLLKKADGRIEWSFPAEKITAFIRGMTPWPGAFTFYGDKRLKIFSAEAVQLAPPQPPGTVVKAFADELRVATGSGALSILEIQGASGRRLPIRDFLRGSKIPPGAVLS